MTNEEPSEKEQIERGTGQIFLDLFNEQYGHHFEIVELADSPDVRCRDSVTGDQVLVEACVLEDLPGDAQYLLDRGPKPPGQWGTGVRGFVQDAVPMLINLLRGKFRTRYGPGTALVIRQLSPLWFRTEWSNAHQDVPWGDIGYKADIFDRGIWILCRKIVGGLGSYDLLRFDPQGFEPPLEEAR